LRAIASKGRDGFYKGPVANEIIKSVNRNINNFFIRNIY